ncbi:Riboflavin transport system permease protein RibX [Paraconexibacter sp. AEG42_29]|uniref:Riboflavin transport system permease protein RibX n=1 Tax=Paraconexibacter sp. AEG42_29 TaxID=2997339 RepID=A0AAU7ATM2_9ACTN
MLAVLILLAFLGGWQAYADLSDIDEFLLPSPTDVLSTAWEDRGLLWDNFQVTAQEMGIGLLIAIVLGVGLALALHRWAQVRRGLYPLLIASQTVPIVLVAPLLAAWLGYDLTPKLIIVALVCFFPIVVPTLDALAGADPGRRKLMAGLGASRWQQLRFVEAPSALPALFTGTRLAVAIAAIAAVLAETAGSDAGLGHLMTQSIPQLETARAFAAVVLLSLFSLSLYAALTLAERRVAPWAHPPKGPVL